MRLAFRVLRNDVDKKRDVVNKISKPLNKGVF